MVTSGNKKQMNALKMKRLMMSRVKCAGTEKKEYSLRKKAEIFCMRDLLATNVVI